MRFSCCTWKRLTTAQICICNVICDNTNRLVKPSAADFSELPRLILCSFYNNVCKLLMLLCSSFDVGYTSRANVQFAMRQPNGISEIKVLLCRRKCMWNFIRRWNYTNPEQLNHSEPHRARLWSNYICWKWQLFLRRNFRSSTATQFNTYVHVQQSEKPVNCSGRFLLDRSQRELLSVRVTQMIDGLLCKAIPTRGHSLRKPPQFSGRIYIFYLLPNQNPSVSVSFSLQAYSRKREKQLLSRKQISSTTQQNLPMGKPWNGLSVFKHPHSFLCFSLLFSTSPVLWSKL